MLRFLLVLFAVFLVHAPLARAQTLDAIRAAHHLDCGVVQGVDDWNGEDVHGNLSALEGEICRAVAVAILGDGAGLTLHPFPAELEAVNALHAGAIQLAIGVSPSTATAVRFGVGFGPPVFYDSQRLLVVEAERLRRRGGTARQADLRHRHEPAPADAARRNGGERHSVRAAWRTRNRAKWTRPSPFAVAWRERRWSSRLAQSRANFHARASDFVFLPERWGVAPVVPAYRYGDQTFGLIVDWTVSALIEAEALGITQANVAAAAKREDMRAEQLLGHDFATAQALGLAHDWAAKVIAATGNYGEIFQRTTGGPFHLDRGLNALWTQGGLMQPLPMR